MMSVVVMMIILLLLILLLLLVLRGLSQQRRISQLGLHQLSGSVC